MKVDCLKKEECCGCNACTNVCPKQCIEMVEDKEGFWYPEINQNLCIDCSKCIQVCPALKENEQVENFIPEMYAANCCNEEIRKNSSSGGIFTLLAEKILLQGGIVFGAAFADHYRTVRHIAVETVEDLEKLRGSKYLQSKIGNSYQQVRDALLEERSVLFSGTPCQVEGLKKYLGKEYERLLCIDLVCHGVPSPKVWSKYVAFQEKCADASIQRVFFRSKINGWQNTSVLLEFSNNTRYISPLSKDLFMRSFLENIDLRPSCGQCWAKGGNRISDITLADFWGVQNIIPEIYDDKGTSFILVHSEKGKDAFESIKNEMKFQEVKDPSTALKRNMSVVQSVKEHDKRKEFFSKLDDVPFDRLVYDLLFINDAEYRWVEDNMQYLKNGKVYVYGAGVIASKIIRSMEMHEVHIDGIIVTNPSESVQKFLDYTVTGIDDMYFDCQNDSIVLAVSDKYQSEILPLLYEKNIKNVLCF